MEGYLNACEPTYRHVLDNVATDSQCSIRGGWRSFISSPHHPPADVGYDEASGTSFDNLLAATIADDTDTLENPDSTITGATAPIVDPSQPVIASAVSGTTTASSDSVASSTGTTATPPIFGGVAILTQFPPPPDSAVLTTSFSLDD